MAEKLIAQSENPGVLDVRSLRKVPLFADMSDEDLNVLAEKLELWRFEAGAELVHQGDAPDALYIIQAGRAEAVVAARDGSLKVVESIGPGEPVGELGLITGEPRTATVRAVEPIVALVLQRDAFSAAMERQGFAQQIAAVLAGRLTTKARSYALEDPQLSRFLFSDTRMGLVWLVIRVWAGYQWLQGGLAKLQNPAWVVNGKALQGFWTQAIVTQPRPIIAYEWYRLFIASMLHSGAYFWFGKVIAVSETAVGIGLILGCLTGLAAFGGILMNVNYMLAGSASINPLLALIEVPIMLAWKVAGWWGVDRFLLGPILRPTRASAPRRSVAKSAVTKLT